MVFFRLNPPQIDNLLTIIQFAPNRQGHVEKGSKKKIKREREREREEKGLGKKGRG